MVLARLLRLLHSPHHPEQMTTACALTLPRGCILQHSILLWSKRSGRETVTYKDMSEGYVRAHPMANPYDVVVDLTPSSR